MLKSAASLVLLLLVVLGPPRAARAERPHRGSLEKVVQAIDYAHPPDLDALLAKYGVVDYLPDYPNPDPAWILVWSPDLELPIARSLVVQAAKNRTWQKQCFADYAAYRAGWKTIEDTYRPKLEDLRKHANYYEQAVGLTSLLTDVIAAAKTAGLTLPDKHRATWVGLPWEIYAAIHDLHHETRREFALQSFVAPRVPEEIVHGFAQYGRPWSSDDTAERDAFCLDAQRLGTQRTIALTHSYDASDSGRLVAPVSEARGREVEKKLGAAHDEQVKRLIVSTPSMASIIEDSPTFNPDDPALVRVAGFTVTSATRKGGKLTIVATRHREHSEYYACRDSGHLAVDSGGGLYEPQKCNTRKYSEDRVATVTFDDLPASVEIAKGDEVTYMADFKDFKQKTLKKNKAVRAERLEFTLSGRHLSEVRRGEETVFHY